MRLIKGNNLSGQISNKNEKLFSIFHIYSAQTNYIKHTITWSDVRSTAFVSSLQPLSTSVLCCRNCAKITKSFYPVLVVYLMNDLNNTMI